MVSSAFPSLRSVQCDRSRRKGIQFVNKATAVYQTQRQSLSCSRVEFEFLELSTLSSPCVVWL